MELSKETILHKKFKRSFKGYDDLEVDQFLDELMVAVDDLNQENIKLKEEANRLKEMEATVANSIVFAQQTAESLLDNAKKEAEEIRSSVEEEVAKAKAKAQSEAELVKQEYLKKQEALLNRVQELQEFADQYQRDIQDMIDKQSKMFEETCLGKREAPKPIVEEISEDALAEPEASQDHEEENGQVDIAEMIQNAPDDEEQLKAAIDEIIS